MRYLHLRGLKDIVEPPPPSSTPVVVVASENGKDSDGSNTSNTNATAHTDPDPTKNAEAYSELIMYLDNRSLSLIMCDAADDDSIYNKPSKF